MRLLLVDDNATVRGLLHRLLADVPSVVVAGHAGCGEEALERCADVTPNLVVMDWSMPGIDGIEATERIRRRHPGTEVVGWTSSGEPGVHEAFREAGAAAVFAKEDTDQLIDFVTRPEV